jgi:hypothetical protein
MIELAVADVLDFTFGLSIMLYTSNAAAAWTIRCHLLYCRNPGMYSTTLV